MGVEVKKQAKRSRKNLGRKLPSPLSLPRAAWGAGRGTSRGGVILACTQGWIARHQGTPELVSIKEPTEDNPWSFFRPAWKKNYGASLPLARMGWDVDAMIRKFSVNNPRRKTGKGVQVPNGLKDRVFFWTQIYSRFNSRMRVVHDRDNPAIIYGYIDFRPLYRSLGGGNASMDAKSNSLEKKILTQLKATLREASGISKTSALEAAERAEVQALLSRVGSLSTKVTEERIADIRTQSGQADFFLQALYRSRNLLPHIESVFRRQHLPGGLRYAFRSWSLRSTPAPIPRAGLLESGSSCPRPRAK